jgi:hypothetical protein
MRFVHDEGFGVGIKTSTSCNLSNSTNEGELLKMSLTAVVLAISIPKFITVEGKYTSYEIHIRIGDEIEDHVICRRYSEFDKFQKVR